MEPENLNEWDEERYRELNGYFRVRIQVLVDADPYIRDMMQQGKSLQLSDLISQLSDDDQELWHEFIKLDAIKLHRDMQDHLEGRGKPYNPRDGFSSSTDDDEDVPPVW